MPWPARQEDSHRMLSLQEGLEALDTHLACHCTNLGGDLNCLKVEQEERRKKLDKSSVAVGLFFQRRKATGLAISVGCRWEKSGFIPEGYGSDRR